ncbi:MAG: short-chain fatty acyl-CoA regulator family protein [Pseudomonadota bacterium]
MAAGTRVPIGDRIRTHRRSAGLTQRALAEAVGVSPTYLSLIESNKRQIGGRLLHQIAGELGVASDTFTALSDDRLAAELDELSHRFSEDVPQSAAELVAFSPGWARILLELYDRSRNAEAQSDHLADRFARDPRLISYAHDILSRITSIRSVAEILCDFEALNADHRRRFTETVASESTRLSHVTREMIEALHAATTADAAGAAVREVDVFLQDRGYYFPAIEAAVEKLSPPEGASPSARFHDAFQRVADPAARAIALELSDHEFRTQGAAERASGALQRYAAGALLMPYEEFAAEAAYARYDLDQLCERFGASFEQVAHRLTSLRRPGAEGPLFAFLRVDPAGTVSKRLSTHEFRFPLFGSCPLWVVFEAFNQPGRTLSQLVDLEGKRFLFIARAIEKAPRRHAQPATRFAVMLATASETADDIVYGDGFHAARDSLVTVAGYECHSCTQVSCTQRAHGGRRAS